MRTFSQISYHERQQIYTGTCQQLSTRKMAKLIGKDHSSISRERNRNSDKYGYLYPKEAQKLTAKRKNINRSKIDRYPELKAFIV
jgi:IS30 family transposase